MLTQHERVKSLAYKHLRSLHGYNIISDFIGTIPKNISNKEILGVYVNRDMSRIFFLIEGIFTEPNSIYINYQDIKEVSVNLDEISKNDAEKIIITLSNNRSLALSIFQPQFIQDSGKRTQEVWSIYSFLKNIIKHKL